jgi:hypothetical protein
MLIVRISRIAGRYIQAAYRAALWRMSREGEGAGVDKVG